MKLVMVDLLRLVLGGEACGVRRVKSEGRAPG